MGVKKFIGTSLSFCMQDILQKKIDISEISAIVTSTRFDSWLDAFDQYYYTYWVKYASPDECKDVLMQIWPLVFQPRQNVYDHMGHYAGKGIWLNTETGEYTKHL